MADCEFVSIDGVWLPAVSDVVKQPEYLLDAERALSGNLRIANSDRVVRRWTVELRSVKGDDVAALTALITSSAAPRLVNVMGEVASALVTLERVRSRPRIITGTPLDQDGDKLRVDMTIEITEIPGAGTYFYEVFTSSGTFDYATHGYPQLVDFLVVGGGGGGRSGTSGDRVGGGGGAGGVAQYLAIPYLGAPVAVTVGAGGAADSYGEDSAVGGILAARGGSPGTLTTPLVGGSGGGGSATIAAPLTLGGAGIPPQGHNGGASGFDGTTRGGGGGGGYNEPGGSALWDFTGDTIGGKGGMGVALTLLGWYAPGAPEAVGGGGGGGGGGLLAASGGYGGGGRGGGAGITASTAQPGEPNTGGGGGGGHASAFGTMTGGAGGSGLVIARWRA